MTRKELLQIAKPILFNTEMVRAILENRKTVTRRICKDGNAYTVPDMEFYDADKRTYAVHNYADAEHTDKLSIAERNCPICPGDILYVRETFQNCCRYTVHSPIVHNKYCFKASIDSAYYGCIEDCGNICNWKPSIHIPKEAARIFLKVKSVRVERLQDITEEDAHREGTDPWDDACYENNGWKPTFANPDSGGPCDIISGFHKLWNSTIKPAKLDTYGWDANPYVWIFEFERIFPD